jgi:hypothetical protein
VWINRWGDCLLLILFQFLWSEEKRSEVRTEQRGGQQQQFRAAATVAEEERSIREWFIKFKMVSNLKQEKNGEII